MTGAQQQMRQASVSQLRTGCWKLTLWARVQGQLEVTTRAGTGKAAKPDASGRVQDVVDSVPCIMLGLDLPPAPLYKDALEKNIIPQVLHAPHEQNLAQGVAVRASCGAGAVRRPQGIVCLQLCSATSAWSSSSAMAARCCSTADLHDTRTWLRGARASTTLQLLQRWPCCRLTLPSAGAHFRPPAQI